MADINWTAEAECWLHDIYSYIAQDNPRAAARTVGGIYEKVQILLEFPQCGYTYKEQPERNIRILLYGHYRIAYLVKPDNDIDVLGVFHGALDMARHLL